ncbi:MAG: AraC family transcriptional regulator [bacterium P3]|nr:MAG: AraC family transcriptional regulator [bacterium P3]
MRHTLLLYTVVLALTVGCTGRNGGETKTVAQPSDTTYTQKAAMAVYDYQPERALQIIDSAVIVGNISEVRADVERARIYSMTQAKSRLDSLLHGPEGTCLDSGRVVGERLLAHDSLKHDLNLRQQLLEILVYTARMQQDTLTWMLRSHELVDVCHEQGLQTEALRTEAELGASLCYSGQMEQGMTQLDSVITALRESPSFKFNELDAFIIASKRKIGVLNSMKRFAETLPLSHRIKELLDDYEQHPDKYHDGSHREPKDSTKRADYIRFYRSQAQNFVTAAYAALGERGSMEETFYEIESTVRDATTREHQARYHALEQQMEAERQRADAQRNALIAWGAVLLALLALCFVVVVYRKNRNMLAQQLTELYDNTRPAAPAVDADLQSTSTEDLYRYIRDEVIRLQLYTDPGFGRQSIIARFHLTKDVASRVFSQGSDHSSISDFINNCRLDHARRLLVSRPDMSIADIATASGFGVRTTFTRSFKVKHGLTPSEFREQQEQS